jgi:drug/metabolite transporter (DMT)-like permease
MTRDWTLALAFLCVLVTAAAQISLKIGASAPMMQSALSVGGLPAFLTRAALTPMVIIGLILYVISTVGWLLVLARAEVSFVYPFVSLGFVVIALFAHFFLQEPLGPHRLAGIALISAGVWLVARS